MNVLTLYMISKVSALYLLCLTMLCTLFALSYNLIIIADHNGVTKVLATSSDDSGGSGNSDDSGGSGNSDDSGGSGNSDDSGGSGNSDDSGGSGNSDDSGGSGNSDDSGGSGNSDDSESLSPIQQPSIAAAPIQQPSTAGDLAGPISSINGGGGSVGAAPLDVDGRFESAPTGPLAGALGSVPPGGVAAGPLVDAPGPSNTLREGAISDMLLADRFRLNSEDIAMEIAYLTPSQIRSYPITDLSSIDLWLVLNILAPADLAKVLMNIPIQDLFVVKQGIGESGFNVLLSKLATSDILFIKV